MSKLMSVKRISGSYSFTGNRPSDQAGVTPIVQVEKSYRLRKS